VAARFQEYRIRGMVYHYVPSSGTAVSGANAALGTVMMSTSYRATDVAPTSKLEMLNEYCSAENSPAEAFCHPVECDPRENPFNVQYVRTGEVPAGDSRMLYDLGITYVAVSGQQANDNVLGDLWVTYEIELKKPIVSSNVSAGPGSANIETSGGSPTGTNLFAGTATNRGQLGVTISGNTISFPRGTTGLYVYMIRVLGVGNFSTFDCATAPTFVNCGAAYYAGTSTYSRTGLGGAGTLGSGFILGGVAIVDPSSVATVTLSTATFTGTTIGSIQLVVAPLDLSY